MPTATVKGKRATHKYKMHCHAVLMGRPNKNLTQHEIIDQEPWPCYRLSPRAQRTADRISHSEFMPWLVYPDFRGLTLVGPRVNPPTPPGTLNFRATFSRIQNGKMSIYVRRNLKQDKRFIYVDLQMSDGLILPEGLDNGARIEGLAIVTGIPQQWQLLTLNKVGEVA